MLVKLGPLGARVDQRVARLYQGNFYSVLENWHRPTPFIEHMLDVGSGGLWDPNGPLSVLP